MKIELGTAALANSLATKGWVVGHMKGGPAKTSDLEVKLWHYDSQPDYPKKVFHGTEFIVIYGGALKISLEKDGEAKEIFLDGGNHDYVVLGPGTAKQVFVVAAPAFGVTVRWPSGPNLNEISK